MIIMLTYSQTLVYAMVWTFKSNWSVAFNGPHKCYLCSVSWLTTCMCGLTPCVLLDVLVCTMCRIYLWWAELWFLSRWCCFIGVNDKAMVRSASLAYRWVVMYVLFSWLTGSFLA